MTKKAIALLLTIVMVVSLLPTAVFAVESDEFRVVISMEGLTLGQGMYVEPKAYTLDEINALIAEENYGPYTEDELTAGMATLAMLLDNGLDYQMTGSWDSGAYLSSVKNIDKGTVDIPAFITENGGPDNDTHDGNDNEYLGEFDYSYMSGWMITVNDFMIDVGCADWNFQQGVADGKCQDYGNTYVVRWHFTLWGYGSDLGYSTSWNQAYYEHTNKDMLYAAYAMSDDATAKAAAHAVMEDIEATEDEVAAATAALETEPAEEYKFVFTTNDVEKLAGLSFATDGNYVSESGTVFDTTSAYKQIDILRGGTEEELEAIVINGTEFKVDEMPSSLTEKTFTGLEEGTFKLVKYASTNTTTWGRLFFKKGTTVSQDVEIQFVFAESVAAPQLTSMAFYSGDLDAGLTPDFDPTVLTGYSVGLKSSKSSMSIQVTAPEGCTVTAKHTGYDDEYSAIIQKEYELSTSGWDSIKGLGEIYGNIPVQIIVTNTAGESVTYELTVVHPDPNPVVDDTSVDVSEVLNNTMAQLAVNIPTPVFGSTGGEWTVLSLARGGYYAQDNAYFTDYYDRIVETVNETAASVTLANGALHKNKSTDNSRLILALSSIGKDATSVGEWNLITPYEDFTWIKKQGINGPIFALIALDTRNYQTEDTTIRQQCVDYILSLQLEDGGWALSGTVSDPDITAMALQALYNYKDQSAVATAAEEAFAWLSSAQNEDGGYSSWGTVNSESIAQVITACATWGINPDTDSRFVKDGGSAVDAILAFYDAEEKGFKHTADGSVDAMATDQACYALVAYTRLLGGKNALYDMSDVTFEAVTPDEPEGITASLGLPAKVEAGQSFNAIISVNSWDNEAGYKLIDFIMNIPDGLTVTNVTAGDRLTGGEVSWNVEAETGKLRVVYFDANENNTLTVTGTDYPAELFTISFQCNATAGASLPISVGGMSLKLSSDSSDDAAMVVINTDSASGTVGVVASTVISYSAVELYTGDDVDLIPSTKKAVAVSVTGIAAGSKLTYNDGTNEIEFLYSAEISAKTGVSSYVAMVDASIEMANFINSAYYTVAADASTITFGDANGDGVINAQDALAAVDAWLRKGEEPTDLEILTLNVNGDSRLNTFDALGIVEAFVNGTEYAVIIKAATLATAN